MLITNFSAGELSENLFGRIDIPQYFQGVSRLENFDVVPTGGIVRRKGFRRLAELPGEGRIIPFIIDRENSYILFIHEDGITVFNSSGKEVDVQRYEIDGFYKDIRDIKELNYCQFNSSIIITHRNYKPLYITYVKEFITIEKFKIFFNVPVVGIDDPENMFFEDDETYDKKKYLQENYPSCVSYLNGRLIFGNTANNNQRLFFSRVNEINNFSTYKKYMTETREYVLIEGTYDSISNTITMTDPSRDILKFKYAFTQYYLDHPFFKDCKVAQIDENSITLSKQINNFTISPSEIVRFLNWKNQIESEAYQSPELYVYFSRWEYYSNSIYTVTGDDNGFIRGYNIYVVMSGGLSSSGYNLNESWSGPRSRVYFTAYDETQQWVYFSNGYLHRRRHERNPSMDSVNYRFYLFWGNAGNQYDHFFINAETARLLTEDKNELKKWVLERIENNQQSGVAFDAFIDSMYNYIRNTMRFETTLLSTGEPFVFYGTPSDIYSSILENVQNQQFFSFYRPDYVVDRTVSADDGFTFEIGSDNSDTIKWIANNKNLIVGTETGEWVIPGNINALNIQAILNSRYGSSDIAGTTIGDAVIFIQTGKKAIVEYYIPQQDNNFRANNMAMLSKNMLHESPAFDFDFQSAPYTRIFISREDGLVACLLYERMTGTFAWGRITTAGHIMSVAVLSGDGQDEVYFVVNRGGTFFLERLDDRDEVYLDGFHKGPPGPGEIRAGEYSGFPYTSRIRSMPVLANDKMKNTVIKTLNIRFHDSYLPKVTALTGVNREVKTDTIAREEPYTGIIQISFPGQYDRDVFFEFVHDKPTRCHILAVHAEAN